jgi:hypothetical protein
MSGKTRKKIIEEVRSLSVEPRSGHAALKKLILDGELDSPISSAVVVHRIREKLGKRWKTSHVQTYMAKFMQAEMVHAIKPVGAGVNYWVLASVPRPEALRKIGKGRKIHEVEEDLFSDKLTKKLRRDFANELEELRDNFGKNGMSTAFLLRKVLEKLIIIVFGKNGKQSMLKDKHQADRWVGLGEMIDIAAQEKLGGVPFLLSKTAREIKGIKFLGDTAAHNPLANVDTKTILPQMPFIITAYEELVKRL